MENKQRWVRDPSLIKIFSGTIERMCSQTKCIVDNGDTNHMTKRPELLCCITCIISSICEYLEKPMMVTEVGSFKSPQDLIFIWKVYSLNCNLIPCGQLLVDLICCIILNGTGAFMYDKKTNKLCLLQLLGSYSSNSFASIKVSMTSHFCFQGSFHRGSVEKSINQDTEKTWGRCRHAGCPKKEERMS